MCRKRLFGHLGVNPFHRSKLIPSARSTSNNSITSSSSSLLGVQPAVRLGIPAELHEKYRVLLFSKRDLKRKLKKFDEDFVEKWGRNPKKSDKEVCLAVLLH